MTNVKFSIIIPVHNSERYLSECLESVISQNYQNFEIIAINDHSFDSSPEILNSYRLKDQRIRIFHSNQKGVSGARNLGLNKASGNFVLMVDSDDILKPKALDILNQCIQHTQAGIVVFDFQKMYRNTNISDDSHGETLNFSLLSKKTFFHSLFNTEKKNKVYSGGYVWNKVVRKDLIKKCYFDLNLSVYEDEDFWARVYLHLNEKVKIALLRQPLYLYRQRLSSLINSKRKYRLFCHYRAHKKMSSYFDTQREEKYIIAKNKLLTLIKLAQLCFSQDNVSCYFLLKKILLKHREKLGVSIILPYVIGKQVAVKYSKWRLNKVKNSKNFSLYWE